MIGHRVPSCINFLSIWINVFCIETVDPCMHTCTPITQLLNPCSPSRHGSNLREKKKKIVTIEEKGPPEVFNKELILWHHTGLKKYIKGKIPKIDCPQINKDGKQLDLKNHKIKGQCKLLKKIKGNFFPKQVQWIRFDSAVEWPTIRNTGILVSSLLSVTGPTKNFYSQVLQY